MTKQTASVDVEQKINEDGLVFRPFPNKVRLQTQIEAYYAKLSTDIRQTFAPVENLITEAMLGYDTNFQQLTNANKEMRGLLVFNQDSGEPTRVNLLHISALEDKSKFEEVLDLGLDYIWKMMHCSSIRIYLHHFKQSTADGQKMKVNEDLKNMLKQRRFKWKTLKNETSTGQRIEILEGLNLEFKEQLKFDTAFIYRRGLEKKDFMRDTFTLELKTEFITTVVGTVFSG